MKDRLSFKITALLIIECFLATTLLIDFSWAEGNRWLRPASVTGSDLTGISRDLSGVPNTSMDGGSHISRRVFLDQMAGVIKGAAALSAGSFLLTCVGCSREQPVAPPYVGTLEEAKTDRVRKDITLNTKITDTSIQVDIEGKLPVNAALVVYQRSNEGGEVWYIQPNVESFFTVHDGLATIPIEGLHEKIIPGQNTLLLLVDVIAFSEAVLTLRNPSFFADFEFERIAPSVLDGVLAKDGGLRALPQPEQFAQQTAPDGGSKLKSTALVTAAGTAALIGASQLLLDKEPPPVPYGQAILDTYRYDSGMSTMSSLLTARMMAEKPLTGTVEEQMRQVIRRLLHSQGEEDTSLTQLESTFQPFLFAMGDPGNQRAAVEAVTAYLLDVGNGNYLLPVYLAPTADQKYSRVVFVPVTPEVYAALTSKGLFPGSQYFLNAYAHALRLVVVGIQQANAQQTAPDGGSKAAIAAVTAATLLDPNLSLFDAADPVSIEAASERSLPIAINAEVLKNEVTLKGFETAVSQLYKTGETAPQIYLVGDVTQEALRQLQDLYIPLIEVVTPVMYRQIKVSLQNQIIEVGFDQAEQPKAGFILSGVGLLRLGLLKDPGVRQDLTPEVKAALEALATSQLHLPEATLPKEELLRLYDSMV